MFAINIDGTGTARSSKKDDPPPEPIDTPETMHRRALARGRWQKAIYAVQAAAPLLKAGRGRSEHWAPLKLRFDSYTVAAPTASKRVRPMGGTKTRNFSMARLQFRVHDPGRSEVRLLKSSDAHITIPPQVGKWLVNEHNLAPDPYDTKGQRILYAAPISMRYKDHVISEGPCSYCLACPFPCSVFSYVMNLWRVYTCAGCSDGVTKFDQPLLWRTKQYHLRTYVHIYNNRIEANYPTVRLPWGLLGCGSWNEDNVVVHYFDRGSFGFRQVPCGTRHHCCCVWEPFGEVVGRQRCPCNGPLVDGQGNINCGQWWCDHWLCSVCCCHFHYPGLQNAGEFAAAADVALQAFFDGVHLSPDDFDKLLDRELALRALPTRQFKRGRSLGGYDLDTYSYSRITAAVAVTFGFITVLTQIFAAIAGALYIQYTVHGDWYASYWNTISEPDHYGEVIENGTKFVINLIPDGNEDETWLRM
mmetsp:Transcript_15660/g.42042  ORF Transcript_15660/g.42042 Transcript_15660/m.42042 type:complete len:473 (-) Transcript_15660:498-1916(-)